jgi:hypothetical protein
MYLSRHKNWKERRARIQASITSTQYPSLHQNPFSLFVLAEVRAIWVLHCRAIKTFTKVQARVLIPFGRQRINLPGKRLVEYIILKRC